MKTESLRARVSRISRQRRGGGTPDAWNRLTPDQMEEFARTGYLPPGVTLGELFPAGCESVAARATSLFDSWAPDVRKEFLLTRKLPADIDSEVFANVFARRGSDR